MGPAVWPAIRITQHIYIYETSCFIILIVNIVNVYMLPLQPQLREEVYLQTYLIFSMDLQSFIKIC